ncbi:MAG: DNA internalization-related competence protein ComEC/Rec2 [Gemmatimonadales bacterium]
MNRPPALLLLLTYGAGLATGLTHFQEPLAVGSSVGLIAVGVAVTRRQALVWPVAILLGLAAGLLARSQDAARCATRLSSGPVHVELHLVEPVSPDARVTAVRLTEGSCAGSVRAHWPAHLVVPAGSRVRATGRWAPADSGVIGPADGILLLETVTTEALEPTIGEQVRGWVIGTSGRLYGARAGTVEALVLNRRAGMPADLKNRYARAGLVHLLSISGFHVGVIMAWVLLLARLAGMSRAGSSLLAATTALAYVIFLGWPPPAARAALLAALVLQGQLRQRHAQTIPLLCVTCVVLLLLDPWAILDAGAWLSASALGGALLATRWSDRALGRHWLWRTLTGSVGATLATAPITAALFGTVSLAGVALNFLAIPLAAVAVPGILFSLLAAAILPPLAAPLAAGAGALLGGLDGLAWWGGKWDALVVIQPAAAASALPWLGVLLVTGWTIAGGTTRWEAARRVALGLALVVWGLLLADRLQVVHDTGSGLALHFLDVGQGDAAVLRTPAGRWILIDAGPRNDRGDAGQRVVAPFLAREHVARLSLAVISHAHADHIGGLRSVIERIPTDQVLEPAELVADPVYTSALDAMAATEVGWRAARDGMRFEMDGVRFTLLHPDTTWAEWRLDLNEDSVVLLVEYGNFRALFPGDAGLVAEARLAGRIGTVDLLKVGHHGSRSATGAPWLEELQPTLAVISAGRHNGYGHPHADVLERLQRAGARIWRTDQDGPLSVRTDGHTLRLDTGWTTETIALAPHAGVGAQPQGTPRAP